MFNVLVKYSIEKGIKLIIDENNIEEIIVIKNYLCKLKNISEINSKFIKLIYFCKNKNIIEVIFSKNSYFLKKFNEINKNKGIENEIKDHVIFEIENVLMKIELEEERREKEKIRKENEIIKIELEEERKEKKIRKDLKLLRIELEEEKMEKKK